MNAACARTVATLLMSAVLTVLPGTATAGGAFFIKGGAMRLHDDGQVFDTPTHVPVNVSLDRVSHKTIGLGWELRLRNGWAVGTEYLGYDNRFTQSSLPSARGIAETDAFLVSGKKYFFDSGSVRPYVGAGFGIGFTDISNNRSGGPISDNNTSLLLHAMLGVELRVDNLSFMLEAKTLNFENYKRDIEYNPSATGVLLGVGFNW